MADTMDVKGKHKSLEPQVPEKCERLKSVGPVTRAKKEASRARSGHYL